MSNLHHVQGQRPGHSDFVYWNSHERLGRWPARQMGLIDLARRCALGQAMRTNGPLVRNRNLHFTTPHHRMSCLKIKVGPVLLNQYGGVMHGVKVAGRRFGRRAVGRQPSVSVRPRHRNPPKIMRHDIDGDLSRQGHPTIAHRFNGGMRRSRRRQSRQGRQNGTRGQKTKSSTTIQIRTCAIVEL